MTGSVLGKLLRNTDLLAGAGAALLLVLCAVPLGLPLPLGIALAAIAYVGLRLALPRAAVPPPEQVFAATLARCEEQITAIQQFAGWAGFAGKPTVRERLLRIHQLARRTLAAIAQDPNKHGALGQYFDEYLTPITAVLASYVRLAGRELVLARDELAAIEEETLPLIERRLNTLYEQIHSADLAALELDTKMLEYTLQPLTVEPPPLATAPLVPETTAPGARRGRKRAGGQPPEEQRVKEQAG